MPRTIVERDRREPRFSAAIEVHIEDEAGRFVSLTREVSKSGLFFFASTPHVHGSPIGILIHPGDEAPIALRGTIRYAIKQIGVGVELDGNAAELERYRAFVDRVASGHAAWTAIGDFVRPANESQPPGGGVFEHKEIVPVGETCRALEILFRRHAPVAPSTVFGAEHAKSRVLSADHLAGVSREPVGLRLHARDRLRMVHVALLRDLRKYAAVLAPEDGDGHRLYALSGTEEIAISAGGGKIFPFFSSEELELIRRDVVVKLPPGVVVPPPERVRGSTTDSLPMMPREVLIAAFKHWTRFAGPAQQALELLIDHLEPETRIYQIGSKQHAVRLVRNVPLLVREDASGEARECALMHDGKRLCALFGLDVGAPKIRPLTASDEVLIRA